MTYTELSDAIKAFAVDAEASFYAQIPNFIRDTEKRIFNEADLPAAQFVATPVITATVATITVPVGWLSVDSLAVVVAGHKQFLTPKSVDFLDTAYPSGTLDVPRYYAVQNDTTIQLAPTPDVVYSTQMRYNGYPESVTTAVSGVTWLSTNYSRALLYGALRDAAVYLKEEQDIVTLYNNQYNEALGQVKNFGTSKSRVDKYRKR